MHVAYLCGLSAHPRVSGENLGACSYSLDTLGSSPRERGKRVGAVLFLAHAGLIPA